MGKKYGSWLNRAKCLRACEPAVWPQALCAEIFAQAGPQLRLANLGHIAQRKPFGVLAAEQLNSSRAELRDRVIGRCNYGVEDDQLQDRR